MTAIDANPVSQNALLPNRFRLSIRRAPNINWWVQSVNVPAFSCEPANQANPFTDIPIPGDHPRWEPLRIEFEVDNAFANYLEIHSWMRCLYFPEDFDQYRQLLSGEVILGTSIKSEIVLMILDGSQSPIFEVVYHDAFPVSIGELQFDSTKEDVTRIRCQVVFKYRAYDINKLI